MKTDTTLYLLVMFGLLRQTAAQTIHMIYMNHMIQTFYIIHMNHMIHVNYLLKTDDTLYLLLMFVIHLDDECDITKLSRL